MKTTIFVALIGILFFTSCSKKGIAKGTPKCIEKEIKTFENISDCNDASVKQYEFQNKTVFVFEPGTCGADMSSTVMSETCSALGYLGGFAGNTEINGE